MKILATILLLSSICLAQQTPTQKTFDWSSRGALIGAMAADELATAACRGCVEKGVFQNTGARVGVKIGVFSVIEVGQHFYKGHGGAFAVLRFMMAGAFGYAAFHSRQVSR